MMQPQIKAEFVLDDEGKPIGRKSGNYRIKLRVIDTPKDAYKVTYQLDSSYYDPVREVLNSTTDFAEELTSYGNYVVLAKVRLADHTISTSRDLFEALRETHSTSPDDAIQHALKAIEKN